MSRATPIAIGKQQVEIISWLVSAPAVLLSVDGIRNSKAHKKYKDEVLKNKNPASYVLTQAWLIQLHDFQADTTVVLTLL
jgi:hypothetical protein